MKPRSLCFVAATAYPLLALNRDIRFAGGAEVQQSLVATQLAARGHDISMVCFDHGQPDGEIVRGVRVYKCYPQSAGLPGIRFFHPRLTGLWSAMKRANADVYYQRTRTMEVGLVAAFARWNKRQSIFAAANDIDFSSGQETLKFGRDRALYAWGVRNVDTVIVQTTRQQELCHQRFQRDSVLIPSGYAHRGLPARHDGPVIWVATAKIYKRPHLFLEVARQLPEYKFRLVGGPASGTKEQVYYQELKAQAAKLPNVDDCGFVPYADVESYFDGGSVFINTSVGEGFPNTFLQAWSRGMPTVSFFDPEVQYKGHKVACTVDSIDSMVARVKALKEHEASWSVIGARARAYVDVTHSIEAVCNAYERVIGVPPSIQEGYAS